MGKVIVVTGPSRSGKSEWAEQLAIASQRPVTYVATAQDNAEDLEWQSRIQQHQARRPSSWSTNHEPLDLVSVLRSAQDQDCLLIDSLGTWVANHLEQADSQWQFIVNQLHAIVPQVQAQLIFVAEETGWGVVPSYPLGRTFRDRLGSLTRSLTLLADDAYLVCSGIAINLKQIGQIVKGPNCER